MKLLVAGQDVSTTLGREIQAAAQRLPPVSGPRILAAAHSAMSLKAATCEADFMARYVKLLSIRGGLETTDFPIPVRPGGAGRMLGRLKRLLWKLLRYQHDRMALQQSACNELLIHGLEFQNDRLTAEVRRLQDRLDALESRAATPPAP